MSLFPKILTTTVLCLSTICCCTQSPQQAALSNPDNMEHFRPIMFYNCVPEGETDPYAAEKEAFRGAVEQIKQLSADEKTLLALAIVDEYDKALTPLGLHLASADFITKFAIASLSNPEVKKADEAMWVDMLGWQDVLRRLCPDCRWSCNKSLYTKTWTACWIATPPS